VPAEVTLPRVLGPESFGSALNIQRTFARRGCHGPGLLDQPPAALRPSESAYRVRRAGTRLEDIKRGMNSLLNKICPDNLERIVQQMAAFCLESAEELELVIGVIFQAALTNSHYCETYADMVFALKSRYPAFPAPTEGQKPMTFTRVLLNTCQLEFESLSEAMEPSPEELATGMAKEDLVIRRKERLLANMRFIGHLFLRNLVSTRILQQVVEDLLGVRENGGLPEDYMVECTCELLTAIGYTLESTESGAKLVQLAAMRLTELKSAKLGHQAAFSKRIRFRIDDLLDLRRSDWQRKLFREQARTLDDVRRDAVKEWAYGASGCGFSTTKAGSQPLYMAAEPAPEPAAEWSPTLLSTSPLPSELEPEVGPPAFGLGAAFDRAFVEELMQHYLEAQDAATFRQQWRAVAPTAAEKARGVLWVLEAGFGGEADGAELAAGAAADLLLQGQLAWEQLTWALRRLVQPELRGDEEGPRRGDAEGEVDAFCRLVARTFRMGLFSPVAFRGLPDDRDLAWQLLTGVLRLLVQDGSPTVQQHALCEFWDVLCALRGVPAEASERGVLRQLVAEGLVLEAVALGALLP